MRALRVFAPQLFGVALATGCGMAWAALLGNTVAVVPFLVMTLISGLATAFTTINKMFNIDDRGWDNVDPPRVCKRCAALAADLDETRKALLELQP